MKILNKKIASKKSSVAWIQRQAADPYVARAHRDGYRARAVYKLIEINEKYKFLKNGQVVVDLGAAPGSWSQYVMRAFPRSRVFAMDLLEISPIPGVEFYQGDFTGDDALGWLVEKLNLPTDGATHGTVDVVLLSQKDFDATKLDVSVTEFGSAWSDSDNQLNRFRAKPLKVVFKDADGDGRKDAVITFPIKGAVATTFKGVTTELFLFTKVNGEPVAAFDTVLITE